LDFFAATSSSKGVGDNGGVIGMSSSEDLTYTMRMKLLLETNIASRH
jgi:hypothetical protein